LSGGILLPTPAQDLGKQLAWAVTLIRGRYIVEFPRPVTTVGDTTAWISQSQGARP
jgi:hypothetical protein